MNISRVKEQLISDEGVVYEIYKDHLGYKTLGVGHLIKQGDCEFGLPVGTSISKEVVDHYFMLDIDSAVQDCYKLYTNFTCYPGEVREILVNMMFNLGRPRLSKFVKLKLALDAHDWVEAAIEGRDSLWYKQVTNRAERLMRRLEEVS